MKVDLFESLPSTWNAIWNEDDENAAYLRDCLSRHGQQEYDNMSQRERREFRAASRARASRNADNEHQEQTQAS
jgi:hypothetical protein